MVEVGYLVTRFLVDIPPEPPPWVREAYAAESLFLPAVRGFFCFFLFFLQLAELAFSFSSASTSSGIFGFYHFRSPLGFFFLFSFRFKGTARF